MLQFSIANSFRAEEEERENIAREAEERVNKLHDDHGNEKKEWQVMMDGLTAEHSATKEELGAARDAHEEKAKEWQANLDALTAEHSATKEEFGKEQEAHKNTRGLRMEEQKRTSELAGSITTWMTKNAEIEQEKLNMTRILGGLGYGTEARSKSDDFL